MTDKINFQGKIGVTQGNDTVLFTTANLSLVAERISKEYESIKGDTISIIKGYKYGASIDIFLLNSDTTNFGKLNKLLGMISSIGIIHPIRMSLYKEDGVTVATHIDFHNITGDINYTDYLSGNAKIGIKFSLSLETLLTVSQNSLLNGW